MGKKRKPSHVQPLPPPPPKPQAPTITTVEEPLDLVDYTGSGKKLRVLLEQIRKNQLICWEIVDGEPTEPFILSRTHGLRLNPPPDWCWRLSDADFKRFRRQDC